MNKEMEFLIYSTPLDDVKVDVVIKDETIWLTQKAIASLFGVQVPAINKHIKNIFNEGELESESTISILEIVQKAILEYNEFNKTQKIISDFDKAVKLMNPEE